MSSQLIERLPRNIRQSLKASKSAYDAALKRSVVLQRVYDKESREYKLRLTEVKRAGKNMNRAQQKYQMSDAARWSAEVDRLEKQVMAPLYLKLERLHTEHELVMRAVQTQSDDIATQVRIIRARILKVDVESLPVEDIKIQDEPHGGFSTFFGGIKSPDGVGHAHYVFFSDGELKYYREKIQSQSAWIQPVPRCRFYA